MAKRINRMKTWALVALAVLATYFAFFGGEYTVPELRGLDHGVASLEGQIAALRTEVDSLQDFARRLENDPKTLERVARERYGMIRDGEILYRFVEPRPPEGSERAR